MPIPSITLTRGMYFGTINGFDASAFEEAYQGGNGGTYESACRTPGVAFFIDSSNNLTDMNSLAVMPFNSNESWISPDEKSQYFSKDHLWGDESTRVGYNFIRHKTPTMYYPLSLAKKGYRTFTSNDYIRQTGEFSDYSLITAYTYDFWNRPIIARSNTSTTSSVTISLTDTGYRINYGTTRSWMDKDNINPITRHWIGVALQAGGGEGGASWINHVGGGGSAGGFWLGLVDLTNGGTTTITLEDYSSSHGGGATGARVTLRNSLCSITVNPGHYDTGGAQGGSTPGGSVSVSGRGYLTLSSVRGGTGGYVSHTGGNRIYPSSVTVTYDQDTIPLNYSRNYTIMYSSVWWGGGVAGQGGCSVMGMGGIPTYSGDPISDAGTGGKFRTYGAGGGGSASGNWLSKEGGTGGYPYVAIGF